MLTIPTPSDIEGAAKEAGLSIVDLCREAEIAPSTFSRWKAGRTSLTTGACQRLVDAIKRKADATPEPAKVA